MDFSFGVTLTVTRPGGTDPYGNPLAGATHTIDGCALWPAGSTEIVNRQATTIDEDTVGAPYDADVLAKDLITIPADLALPAGVYEVNGTPARFKNPFTGDEAGTVIRVRRVTG
jgi:hypothetical protein